MVTLLIDAGNSRVKLCYLDDEHQQPEYFVTDHLHIHEAKAWLDRLPNVVEQAYGVNVAGQFVRTQIESLVSIPVVWKKSEAQTLMLRCAYRHEQLGSDRWYALLGLRKHCPEGYAMLVGMGTATTIDSLSDQHEFLGGLILPGTLMMTKSLHNGTANLPQVRTDHKTYHPPAFPMNTLDAIRSGIIIAQCGAICRQWHALRLYAQEHGESACEPSIYLAGGARHDVLAELRRMFYEQYGFDLPLKEIKFPVLDGLQFYVENKDKE